MIIDTHAHINHELIKDEKGLLDEVDFVVCPSYSVETCKSCMQVVEKYSNVYGALAVHPSEEKSWDERIKNFIEENSKHKKIVALGEYGLDYHFLPFSKVGQQNVMLAQLEIAKKQKLPSIFHIRDAFDDFVPIMKENLNNFCGGVVHCFDADKETAKKVLDLGLMISFTGLITFKKNEAVREAVKFAPLDRIMLETDSPYLAPEPFRGKVCFPKYVQKVYEKVAEIKGISMEKLEEQMFENVKKFFYKMEI